VAVLALILVTAVWGVTFVQVKDAVEVYPLYAFLALRFAIAGLALAPAAIVRLSRVRGTGGDDGRTGQAGAASDVGVASERLRTWPKGTGVAGFLGLLLAAGYALQTEGLARTTVSSTGFVTGLYVVFTPLLALVLFRQRIGPAVWLGVALSVAGLAMLSGIHAGSAAGDALVLAASAVYSLQIVLLERVAQRLDPVALTFAEMLAACAAFAVIAVARSELEWPHGWTVWGALLVTGLFASALGFLVQTWAQRRTSATRTALAFTMEPAWTALFGYSLAGDRLGALGWGGCAAILSGIVLVEPTAERALRRLLPRR
jgi:drug/metabolite transporter (DMT)-like permease